MESDKTSLIRRFLIKLFLDRNTLPPYLQIIQICVETVLYIAVTNGFLLPKAIFSSSQSNVNTVIALLLGGTFIARLLTGHSLTRFIYIPILAYSLPLLNTSLAAIAFLVVTIVLSVADIISSVGFDFYSENLSS